METVLLVVLLVLCMVLGMILLLLLRKVSALERDAAMREGTAQSAMGEAMQGILKPLSDSLLQGQNYTAQLQAQRLESVQRAMATQGAQAEERMRTFAQENERKLENIRLTVEHRLGAIQQDTGRRLDEMREIVDEKLQKTLEERMTHSFGLVSERLEQVYRGLGEMQILAAGVGDLKKVLSNVKTRGILGEVQLGAILRDILAPGQFGENVAVSPGSRNVVEFAVRLPAADGGQVWLPIDSKFPGDAYTALREAYDTGDPAGVLAAWNVLQARLRSEAKDIRDKYIDPPNTTEFAVLFLPFEGLYAEAVNRGMIEMLQHDFHVNLAGPSTMAALLNSLQMGFRAFALQQRSAEVWKTLSGVKKEFERFADVLAATQQRMEQARTELDRLVGVRTRQIQKTLESITELEMPAAVVVEDVLPE